MLVLLVPLSLACQEHYPTGSNVTIIDVIEFAGENAVCDIFIYNNETLNQSGTMLRSGLQYRHNAGLLTRGVYTASINCTQNATNYYIGECKFKVQEEDNMIIAALIIIPILFSFALLWIGKELDPETHSALRIFLFLLSIIPFFVSFHFGLISTVEFYDFPELQNLIGSTTYYIGMTLFIMITYFLIFIFYTIMNRIKDEKERRYE